MNVYILLFLIQCICLLTNSVDALVNPFACKRVAFSSNNAKANVCGDVEFIGVVASSVDWQALAVYQDEIYSLHIGDVIAAIKIVDVASGRICIKYKNQELMLFVKDE
ncbi:hypothetical protein FJ364_05655 [Candidatus Dependentiae bacterium]|nr:hypothetical protein [Candidatus Dependentiae bacterium]